MPEPALDLNNSAPVADAPGDDHVARDPEAVCHTLLNEWIAGNGHHMLTYQVKDNQICCDHEIECGTPLIECVTPLLESDLPVDNSEVGPNPTGATQGEAHQDSDVEVMWEKDPTPAKDLSREAILERLRGLVGFIQQEKFVYYLVHLYIFRYFQAMFWDHEFTIYGCVPSLNKLSILTI